ncbi:pyridoxal phosphate-dependent aminotransferase [Lewinella cohaerens]|uniref:pyridoxal phosphate-dependent aminotransferase n=1 Tax=Lewinella cohaerens TaxID=70995 RepID=UPI00037AEB65|nr:aminotransferase class I/II-fold pyridoxal phosphate-dependent enzyme [Lewinella cohaerens]
MISSTIIAPAQRLGQVEEYYFSRKLREIAEMRATGHDVLNLGIGSPDLPPHSSVINRLQEAGAQAGNHGYQSYQGVPELREAFAEWYERYFSVQLDAATEVLPLIGSKEGIMHISMAFLNPGDEVLVPNPGYPTYRSATELAGGVVRSYDLSEEGGWFPDLEVLAAKGLERVKIMWVNYPHMPTGTPAQSGHFEALVAFAKAHGILLVNDNPYAFILNEEPGSLLAVPGAKEVALELNSLSKAHNMAGWRVGVLVGAAEYLQIVLRFKSNMDSGMFKPVQLAAIAALELPASWYASQNEVYGQRKAKAVALLEMLGCEISGDQVGMFVWARAPKHHADAYELTDAVLAEKHIFLTPGGIFGSAGEQYVRISLCSPVEVLEQAINRLKNFKA